MFDFSSRNNNKELQDFITTIAYIAEYKEWDNRTHLERIRRYSYIIGSGAGMSVQDNETISIASQLHDVGKITLPEDLLKKSGQYTESEWILIERHTSEGAAILQNASHPILLTGSTIALTHHERWDGSGYPNNLTGENIPLAGRICALADVFDALTTHRAYKETLESVQALNLIREASGVLFDPKLVRVFEQKFEEINKVRMAYL